jgi:putative redox protein
MFKWARCNRWSVEMAHANASIGTTNYSVEIMAGRYALNAEESVELGGKDSGPSPFELACAALCACTVITLPRQPQWR